ncbi:hypothetical protein NIES2119_23050 [[Phormidium ambiguum] IAM M-71]|uniref:Uncharacterized protein n=1 Tax=[Phormidium ambiguum] IAM M-71 TaxID=454136 RepID=A0A1U7IAB5_9CYAN|nr:hypothetical protein [Phormidium ambiguum]OKH33457.1 hypothetical protein NIES2119_23050 [Phormidium ambiguum IAM M-71]
MTTIKHQHTGVPGNVAKDESKNLVSSLELTIQTSRSLEEDQQTIYNFLFKLVRRNSSEIVLQEFRKMFIEPIYDLNSEPLQALYRIVLSNNEIEFINTLKRCCYILINNWDSTRQHQAIRNLVEIFPKRISHHAVPLKLYRISNWMNKFVNSKDYEDLKVFAFQHESGKTQHWSDRYTSYLLVPQYIESNNPVEQRQAAKTLAKQLKDKFKLDLAMYTARNIAQLPREKHSTNPTGLGEQVIDVIKILVAQQGSFKYNQLARIFLRQTHNLNYEEFKVSLHKYLTLGFSETPVNLTISNKLTEMLKTLHPEYNGQKINRLFLLKTCQFLIDKLTITYQEYPSELFVLLLSQKKTITLVILLLKIVLICPFSQTHLDTCIADLIQHYKKLPEQECQWVINFVEIFNIAFTIYTEDVEYNLVKFDQQGDNKSIMPKENYRLFSQIRLKNKIEQIKFSQENL